MAKFNGKMFGKLIVVSAVAIVVTGLLGGVIPSIFDIGFFGLNSIGQILTMVVSIWAGLFVSDKLKMKG